MTIEALNPSGAADGRTPSRADLRRGLFALARRALPVIVVAVVLIALWWPLAGWLNAQNKIEQVARWGVEMSWDEAWDGAFSQPKPFLPTPGQIWESIRAQSFDVELSSARNLLYHAGVTLTTTLVGFLMGSGLGVLLAIFITHNRASDLSVMPWIIISQTIPILAIAPMLVTMLGSMGLTGLAPKALIATYLGFFPIAVGMVKGFRSPDPLQLDLMKTYSATTAQTFRKLRWPSATPFLFASMKVAIALSLVGAIVGEVSTGTAGGGLGARLLLGSYNGETIKMWAALVVSAAVAALLVASVALIERAVRRRMGLQSGGAS